MSQKVAAEERVVLEEQASAPDLWDDQAWFELGQLYRQFERFADAAEILQHEQATGGAERRQRRGELPVRGRIDLVDLPFDETKVSVARTGYTGEEGFEIILPATAAPASTRCAAPAACRMS